MSFTTIVLCPVLIAILGIPKTPQEPLPPEAAIVAAPTGDRQPGPAAAQDRAKHGTKAEKPSDRFRWDEHPSLHLGKGTRIDFRARFQGDLRESDALLDAAEENSGLDIARRRVGVAGEIRNTIGFQVEAELGNDEPWRDVYANYKQHASVQVQGGHFKLPFSLDENTSATNLDFVYRSRAASQLAPGRDAGIMVHGRVLDRALTYEAGIFSHDGRNARTADSDRVHGGRTLAGRMTFQPFRGEKSWRSDVQIGAAFTASPLAEGFSDLRGKTALDARFYRPESWVDGNRRRIGTELRWRPGPFSIKSEYMRVTDERRGQSVDDTDLSPAVADGWYVSGTWAVTGEAKAEGLDLPRKPLLRGGVGAIELAARVERLSFGSAASGESASEGPRAEVIAGNSDRVETFGANWYPSRFLKIQFNILRDTLRDPSQGPLPDKTGYWSRVLRFQLAL
jgi:phosphate-selective porin OprO/OprP